MSGVSIVRGVPVPVVRVAHLLGGAADSSGARVVSLRVGGRRVSLEVDDVLGVGPASALELATAPPLLEGAAAQYIQQLGSLDGRLLATLATGRIVEDASLAAPNLERR